MIFGKEQLVIQSISFYTTVVNKKFYKSYKKLLNYLQIPLNCCRMLKLQQGRRKRERTIAGSVLF